MVQQEVVDLLTARNVFVGIIVIVLGGLALDCIRWSLQKIRVLCAAAKLMEFVIMGQNFGFPSTWQERISHEEELFDHMHDELRSLFDFTPCFILESCFGRKMPMKYKSRSSEASRELRDILNEAEKRASTIRKKMFLQPRESVEGIKGGYLEWIRRSIDLDPLRLEQLTTEKETEDIRFVSTQGNFAKDPQLVFAKYKQANITYLCLLAQLLTSYRGKHSLDVEMKKLFTFRDFNVRKVVGAILGYRKHLLSLNLNDMMSIINDRTHTRLGAIAFQEQCIGRDVDDEWTFSLLHGTALEWVEERVLIQDMLETNEEVKDEEEAGLRHRVTIPMPRDVE